MDTNGRTRRVLIADDEGNFRTALKVLLQRKGFEVHCAGDGEEALRAVQKSPPEVLLLDVKIAGKSGYEVCQAVKSDPSLAAVRILMVSAQCRHLVVEKSMALGADGFLTKPFSPTEVLGRIEALLACGDVHV